MSAIACRDRAAELRRLAGRWPVKTVVQSVRITIRRCATPHEAEAWAEVEAAAIRPKLIAYMREQRWECVSDEERAPALRLRCAELLEEEEEALQSLFEQSMSADAVAAREERKMSKIRWSALWKVRAQPCAAPTLPNTAPPPLVLACTQPTPRHRHHAVCCPVDAHPPARRTGTQG